MHIGLIKLGGFVGVLFVLFAYLCLQSNRLKQNDLLYVLANTIGSMLILFTFSVQWNLCSFLIELCWLSISLYGLVRVIKVKFYNKTLSINQA